MDLVAAIKAVDQFLGIKPARSRKKSRCQGEVVATYVYVPGKQEARRIQYENGDKVVKPFHHNGTRWVGCMGPRKPPKANPWIAYRQDKVLGAETVYEFEGEKCADIAASDGLAAISQPGFAHGVDQVAERYRCLKEAGTMLVVTVADHDEEGPKRAQRSGKQRGRWSWIT